MNRSKHFIAGTMLVAGTSIGGGMLALPVSTSLCGFFPSILLYFVCWALMTSTALIFVELTSGLEKGANVISMAEETLGRGGKVVAWLLYLFLFYSLTVVYIVACGGLLADLLQEFLPRVWGPFLFVLVFAPLVAIGARVVGPVNDVMMIGLILSYAALFLFGYRFFSFERLLVADYTQLLPVLPFIIISFAFQGVVPTLVNYMQRDYRLAKWAVVLGSILAFFVYLIWNGFVLGIVPVGGKEGLHEAFRQELTAITPLKQAVRDPWISFIGSFLAFFALITSFFGVTLGLTDFLADGLNIKKNKRGKILLFFLVFLPPLAISFTYPDLFLTGLAIAGGYGVTLLLGLLPIVMVWSWRYCKRKQSPYRFPGGRPVLFFLTLFFVFQIAIQSYS